MQSAFGILIFVVVAVAAVVAVITLVNRGDVYDQIGRGGLSLNEEPDPSRPAHRHAVAGSPADSAEAEEEVRQMVTARRDRLERQGKPGLDVEAEVARLMSSTTTSSADPALVDEVRQLVHARNSRRARQGKPELDVEAEVARQLAELRIPPTR
jgi:hypothetical protein